FATQSSLAELLPAELASLSGWNLQRSSALAMRLITDDRARMQHVEALRCASRKYTWQQCAERTIEAYRRALASRARSSAREAWEAFEREREIVRLDEAVHGLQARLRELGGEIQAMTDSLGTEE